MLGGLDLMATFAEVAGIELPKEDREGQPIIFDSYDMTPVWEGTGPSERTSWFYFTEDELSPGAARVGNYKAVFNLRGDDGAETGGLAVDSNLGWKGAESYVATVPQLFDLLADPQERYDIFMNNFTETTWFTPVINDEVDEADEDLCRLSAAEAAERGLFRADHADPVPALPERARAAGQGRLPPRARRRVASGRCGLRSRSASRDPAVASIRLPGR